MCSKIKLFLTINVPVVFMARYVMVLRGATSLRGALEGVALKIETFLGPEMARAKRVPFGPNALRNDVAPLKTIKYKRHKNNWYIGSFMYPSAVVVCKMGGEVSLKLCCVRRYSGGGGWLAGLPLPSHYSVGIHGCMLMGGGGAIVT